MRIMIVTGAVSGMYDRTRANVPLGCDKIGMSKNIGMTDDIVATMAVCWLSRKLFPSEPNPAISVPNIMNPRTKNRSAMNSWLQRRSIPGMKKIAGVTTITIQTPSCVSPAAHNPRTFPASSSLCVTEESRISMTRFSFSSATPWSR